MGNCLFGGLGEAGAVIKVVTSNGGIMEFYAPVTAECITNEFPGHGIFRSHDLFWKPLSHHEELHPGESYFLLPINNTGSSTVWKVKLVICPEQLLEILSQEARTQELIESVRTVAKCGNGVSPMGFSDQLYYYCLDLGKLSVILNKHKGLLCN
ncbi:unnamed protein product, partial [Vitis vinifera]